MNTHFCHDNATCTDTPLAHVCTCSVGFTGSGTHCVDIDECEGTNDCDPNAQCDNTIGQMTCVSML